MILNFLSAWSDAWNRLSFATISIPICMLDYWVTWWHAQRCGTKVCFYHYCIVGFFEVYKFCVFRRCWSFVKFNPLKKQTSYPLQCWSLADPFMKMKSWKLKISHSWNLSTLKKPTIRYIDKINVILHIQVVLIAVLWTYLKATLRESMECVGGCRQIIIKRLLVNFQ